MSDTSDDMESYADFEYLSDRLIDIRDRLKSSKRFLARLSEGQSGLTAIGALRNIQEDIVFILQTLEEIEKDHL